MRCQRPSAASCAHSMPCRSRAVRGNGASTVSSAERDQAEESASGMLEEGIASSSPQGFTSDQQERGEVSRRYRRSGSKSSTPKQRRRSREAGDVISTVGESCKVAHNNTAQVHSWTGRRASPSLCRRDHRLPQNRAHMLNGEPETSKRPITGRHAVRRNSRLRFTGKWTLSLWYMTGLRTLRKDGEENAHRGNRREKEKNGWARSRAEERGEERGEYEEGLRTACREEYQRYLWKRTRIVGRDDEHERWRAVEKGKAGGEMG